jgi:hypothetical protein
MREYDDPDAHVRRYMKQAALKYTQDIRRRGLQDSPILRKAAAERALQGAEADYIRKANETYRHNIAMVVRRQKREENAIKRRGKRFGWCVLFPIGIGFGILAWWAYEHPQEFLPGASLMYGLASFAFLVIVIGGAIFDRPSKLD